ncbi:MAG: terminase small subunit [Thermonemataceae bacterium]
MGQFQEGNDASLRWTKEKAEEFLTNSLDKLVNNKKIRYIGSLAVEMNEYRELYSYLLDKFPEFHTIKNKIDAIIEARLYEDGLKGDANATLVIFGLKNNHGWKDKTEHEVTKKQANIDLTKLTDEQLRELAILQSKSRVSE